MEYNHVFDTICTAYRLVFAGCGCEIKRHPRDSASRFYLTKKDMGSSKVVKLPHY
jgi:hypothetical protein